MKKLIGILIAVIILLSGVVVYLVVTKDNNVSENPGGNNPQEQTPENLEVMSKNLYDKYISYNGLTGNNIHHKNIDVNNTNSDEYLVTFAISKIMKDNNVNIKNYPYSSGFESGYSISTNLIEKYIKDNFNITRTINYENLKEGSIKIGSSIGGMYYKEEKVYKVVDRNTIPNTNFSLSEYSKLIGYEKVNNELVLYTNFIGCYSDGGLYTAVGEKSNLNYSKQSTICNSISNDYKNNKDVFENEQLISNNLLTEFKHIFVKGEDGNYYWSKTEKVDYSKYVPSDGTYVKTVTRIEEINGKTEKLNVVVYSTEEGHDNETVFFGKILLNDKVIIEKAQLNNAYDNSIALTSIKDTKTSDEYTVIDIKGGNYTDIQYGFIINKNEEIILNEKSSNNLVIPNGENYSGIDIKNNKVYIPVCPDGLYIIEIENGKVVKNLTTYSMEYFEGGC